jgi:steroid delta-isomerase-like uncharacterized protein
MLGCNSEVETAARNKAIAIQAFDVLNNHEYEKLDQLYTQDFHRYCQATPEAIVESLDDFKALLSEWDKQFPDAKMELQLIAAEKDLVAFYVIYSGTHEGQMDEFPPTGKIMTIECAGFHRFEQGKIAETWITWDNLSAFIQLGLFPPPTQDQP